MLSGLLRIEAGKHRVGDLLVGAALGADTALLITRCMVAQAKLIPWGDARSGGIAVAMQICANILNPILALSLIY
jgi:ABC-type phosphonate transport system ATPase subunit